MKFIITEHPAPKGYVNVCIINHKGECLINHLCDPEQIKLFRECRGDWEQLSMRIERINTGELRDRYRGSNVINLYF